LRKLCGGREKGKEIAKTGKNPHGLLSMGKNGADNYEGIQTVDGSAGRSLPHHRKGVDSIEAV